MHETTLHRSAILEEQLHGLIARQSAIESDKAAALTLAHQDYKEKLKSVSMDVVILNSQNKSYEEKIKRLEQIIKELEDPPQNSTYQQLYLNERAQNLKLQDIMHSQEEEIANLVKNSNSLKTVATKAASVLQKEHILAETHQGILLRNFLLALELHRNYVAAKPESIPNLKPTK